MTRIAHGLFAWQTGFGRVNSSRNRTMNKPTWQRTQYANGQTEWETPLLNALPHGVERHYRDDGTLIQETRFLEGRKDGVEKRFRADGATLLMEIPYKDGRFDGDWNRYDASGRLRSQVPYVKGLQHGRARVYDRIGDVIDSEAWHHGTGEDRRYDDAGRLRSRTMYRDGDQHGPMREFDATGVMTREWFYVRGYRRTREQWEGHEAEAGRT